MEPASFNWNHIIVGLRRVKWLQICFLSLLLGMYFCMMSLKTAIGGCSVSKVPTAWLGIKPEQLKLNVWLFTYSVFKEILLNLKRFFAVMHVYD